MLDGGRLIVAADSGDWATEFEGIAARFGVFYGESFVNGIRESIDHDLSNPLFDGPAGLVSTFQGASVNDSLTSTNPAWRVAARWEWGGNAIGYLRRRAGEVVFLTDFNTWDNDMIANLDNEALWRNLFVPDTCPFDPDGDDQVGVTDLLLLLAGWGPGAHAADFDGDGEVGILDVLDLLANWGTCPCVKC